MSTPRRRCSICEDQRKNDWVARRHLEGHSLSTMESMSRTHGLNIKRETIRRHLDACLAVPADMSRKDIVKVAATVAPDPLTPSEDVAVLVQREVIKRLKEGEARVTVQHGLQAQQLLDRRAERAKDRELAITLARLLHSGLPPAAMVARRVNEDDEAIEGTAVEVM